MPNYVFNNISFHSNIKEREEILSLMTNVTNDRNGNKTRVVTFDKLIPMPERLSQAIMGNITNFAEIIYFGKQVSLYEENVEVSYDEDRRFWIGGNDLEDIKLKTIKKKLLMYYVKYTNLTDPTVKQIREFYLTFNDYKDKDKDYFVRVKGSIEELDRQLANLAEYGHASWYSWAWANWGTKWDACHSEVEEDDDFVNLRFSTAWASGHVIAKELSTRFPLVKIIHDHNEETEDCVHVSEYLNGEITRFDTEWSVYTTEEGIEYTSPMLDDKLKSIMLEAAINYERFDNQIDIFYDKVKDDRMTVKKIKNDNDGGQARLGYVLEYFDETFGRYAESDMYITEAFDDDWIVDMFINNYDDHIEKVIEYFSKYPGFHLKYIKQD